MVCTDGAKYPVKQSEIVLHEGGGSLWIPIVSLDVDADQDGWTVPAIHATRNRCRVKILLKDKRAHVMVSDVNDDFFPILFSAPQ